MIIFFASMAHHLPEHASHAVSRVSVAALIPHEKRAKLAQPLSQNTLNRRRNEPALTREIVFPKKCCRHAKIEPLMTHI